MHEVKAAGIAPRYAAAAPSTPRHRAATLRPVKHLRFVLAALAATTLAACQAESRGSDDRENLRQRLALSQRLLEIADDAHSATEQAVVQGLLRKDSSIHVAAAQRMHAHVSTVVRSLALTQAPEQAIVRLYVWVRLAEWSCHNRVAADPTTVPDNCDMVFPDLRLHIDGVAAKVIDAETLRHLDGIVARYEERHPNQLSIGLVRIDDLADHMPEAQMILERAAPTMMSPVSDAARELEQTRILGSQLVWLMARMPTTLGDEIESTVRVLLESDRVREANAGLVRASDQFANAGKVLQELAKADAQIATRVDALAGSVDRIGASISRVDSPRDLVDRALIGGGVIAFASVAGAVGGAVVVLRRHRREGAQRPGERGSA